MCMNMCSYLFMYVCMSVCTCANMYRCTVSMYLWMHTNTFNIYIYKYVYRICIDVSMYWDACTLCIYGMQNQFTFLWMRIDHSGTRKQTSWWNHENVGLPCGIYKTSCSALKTQFTSLKTLFIFSTSMERTV